MTVLGWDTSHFDGTLSAATLSRAYAEGIGFFTHKIAEGTQDTEGSHDDTALAAARDVGIEFLGGYLIPRTYTSVQAQVDFWLTLADAGEPWWRDFPGWFWQVDLERWPYDNVPASVGIACAQELRNRTGKWTILYASHGQYGDQLTGWDGPLWNADYVSGSTSAAALYPGDEWVPSRSFGRGGWSPYSGQEPTFLQYADTATIAGLTARDANAFRGDIDELRQLIEGGSVPNYAANAERYLWKLHIMDPEIDGIDDAGGQVVHSDFIDVVNRIDANVAALTANLTSVTARMNALETQLAQMRGGTAAATTAQTVPDPTAGDGHAGGSGAGLDPPTATAD